MNLPFFIARRYIVSKKSTNAINIISGISAIGVAVASMALVVTLSVFNGFHDLVASLFTTFDPQLRITPLKGKTALSNDSLLLKVRELPQIAVAMETIEDQALATYNGRQAMIILKGVDNNFDSLTHIREILVGDGTYEIGVGEVAYGILGIRLAETLNTGYRFNGTIKIYAPKREGQPDLSNPEEGFRVDELFSPGTLFYVKQAKYDKNYIITNIEFARNLFRQEGRLTALELRLKPGSDLDAVKKEIRKIVGEKFEVRDRYEQQEDTFRVMSVEKLIGYIFLTFILIVACLNIIGSISMLIIDKKEDVATLRSLGADDSLIEKIFLLEGWMISTIGAIVGISLGLLLCWLQNSFGLVGLGRSSGSFIVDAYPVSVHATDIIIIFVTVIVVGFAAVYYPVRYLTRKLLIK